MSTSFHPQMDGQTERTNRTLEQYLRCYIDVNMLDWEEWFPLAEFSINNAWQDTIQCTPFEMNGGQHPKTPLTKRTKEVNVVQWGGRDLGTPRPNGFVLRSIGCSRKLGHAMSKPNRGRSSLLTTTGKRLMSTLLGVVFFSLLRRSRYRHPDPLSFGLNLLVHLRC